MQILNELLLAVMARLSPMHFLKRGNFFEPTSVSTVHQNASRFQLPPSVPDCFLCLHKLFEVSENTRQLVYECVADVCVPFFDWEQWTVYFP